MEIRTKNKIGTMGFALLLAGTGVYFAAPYWPAKWTFSRPRGITAAQALATDVSGFDDQQMLAFIQNINLDNSTPEQQVQLVNNLKAKFDLMPMTQKFSMMMAMMKTFLNNAKSALMGNTKTLMRAYMTVQTRQYMAASPEERKKILDARIDEQLAMESLQKVQGMAQSLLGGKSSDPAASFLGPDGKPDINKFRGVMGDMINDSVINTPPQDRAAAAQFYLDMRARRQERGLPNMF